MLAFEESKNKLKKNSKSSKNLSLLLNYFLKILIL